MKISQHSNECKIKQNDFSIHSCCGRTYTAIPAKLLDKLPSKTSMTFTLQSGRVVKNTLMPLRACFLMLWMEKRVEGGCLNTLP